MYTPSFDLFDGHLEISGDHFQLKCFMDTIYKSSEDFRMMKFYMNLNDEVLSMYPTNTQCQDNVIAAGVKHILLKCIKLGIGCNGRFTQLKYPKSNLCIRVVDNVVDVFYGKENIYGRELDLKIDYDRSVGNEIAQLAERMRCRRILLNLDLISEDVIQYIGEYI